MPTGFRRKIANQAAYGVNDYPINKSIVRCTRIGNLVWLCTGKRALLERGAAAISVEMCFLHYKAVRGQGMHYFSFTAILVG